MHCASDRLIATSVVTLETKGVAVAHEALLHADASLRALIVPRASRVDLDDGAVQGGRFVKSYLGANWWATTRLKFGGGWGRTWLEDAGTRGVTDALLLRAQWVY